MPKGDKTGPWGRGSRTGRGLGYCSGYSSPGYAKFAGMGWGRAYGRGQGWGRGRGWGRGGWSGRGRFSPTTDYPVEDIPWRPMTAFSPMIPVEDEEKYLEETLSGFKKEIEAIEKRLEELQMKNKNKEL